MSIVVVVAVVASARVVPAMACANHSCKDISFSFPVPQYGFYNLF